MLGEINMSNIPFDPSEQTDQYAEEYRAAELAFLNTENDSLRAVMPDTKKPDLKRAIYKTKISRYYDVEKRDYIDESEVDQSRVIDISTQQVSNDDANGEKNLRYGCLELYNLPVGDCLLNLEELRDRRLEQLSTEVDYAMENGTVMSSLGFKIDATEKAITDTDGLIKILEATGQAQVSFCDADNVFHDISLAQVKQINLEIIDYKQKVRAKKWNIRSAIVSATTREELMQLKIEI